MTSKPHNGMTENQGSYRKPHAVGRAPVDGERHFLVRLTRTGTFGDVVSFAPGDEIARGSIFDRARKVYTVTAAGKYWLTSTRDFGDQAVQLILAREV